MFTACIRPQTSLWGRGMQQNLRSGGQRREMGKHVLYCNKYDCSQKTTNRWFHTHTHTHTHTTTAFRKIKKSQIFQACLYRINRRAVHTWPITTFFMRLWLTIIWQKWVQLQQQEWGFGGIRWGFAVGMKVRRGRKLSLSSSESGRRIS